MEIVITEKGIEIWNGKFKKFIVWSGVHKLLAIYYSAQQWLSRIPLTGHGKLPGTTHIVNILIAMPFFVYIFHVHLFWFMSCLHLLLSYLISDLLSYWPV